eukprot:7060428-Prorocentrum_lima.AAC.1
MIGHLRTSANYVAIGNYWYQWIVHHVHWKLIRPHRTYPMSSGVAGDIMQCRHCCGGDALVMDLLCDSLPH